MKGCVQEVLRKVVAHSSSEPCKTLKSPCRERRPSTTSKLRRESSEMLRTNNKTNVAAAAIVTPKCARCKNHGIICQLKGHKGLCKWKDCTCPNCSLIVERQKIMAAEQSVLKEMAEQASHGAGMRAKKDFCAYYSSNTPRNEDITNFGQVDMAGVKECICLHFGTKEARTTMAELEEWREKDPQPCYIKILRRLFPDIKPKVLQLLLAACDGDLIKTVETILPCCKKTNSNGQVTYIKASTPPQKVMLLSRSHKMPARLHDKREGLRYTPYPVDRTHGRCAPYPGLYVPPYAPVAVAPGDNCGLCVSGFSPRFFLPRPRIARDPRNNFPYFTTPRCNFGAECKTVTSSAALGKDDTRTSAAATLISLSNS